MQFAIPVRAASKEDTKIAILEELDEISATTGAPIEWQHVVEAAGVLIDALEDNPSLDIVVTLAGEVVFEGDTIRHVTFSFAGLLTDRV